MACCANCSKELIPKEGTRKFCAQIGNPEIAIIETTNPNFCNSCNEYFINTESIIDALLQVKKLKESESKTISVGIYN